MQQSRRPQYDRPQPAAQNHSALLYKKMTRKEFFATLGALLVGILLFAFFEQHHRDNKPAGKSNSSVVVSQATQGDGFNKNQYSLTDPTSIWTIVNKPRPLTPINFAPTDLIVPNIPLRVPGNETMQVRKVTANALETMFTAAKTDGMSLMLASGYRSYAYQVTLYNGYVQSQGQTSADQASARPGHSEHQTGLAADIEPASKQCELDACFGQLPEGKWLVANAYKYGFIIRYPSDKVAVTGYEYEPWHVRYIGVGLATELHNKGAETLEEFFGVKGGGSYN
jgi:D-alanyl-D-alanine carboxypeptidase